MSKPQGNLLSNSITSFELTQDQSDFLTLYAIPTKLKLISRDFDTKHIKTDLDVWRAKYSGRSFLFKFDMIDSSKNKFLK